MLTASLQRFQAPKTFTLLQQVVLVLAGQVDLAPAAREAAGITAAHALADYAGSVQAAIDDAAAQLEGLAERTAAGLSRE